MFKKIFAPASKGRGKSSSSDSGVSEIVNNSEILTAAEKRHYFSKPVKTEPKETQDSFVDILLQSIDPFDKNQLKHSRSFCLPVKSRSVISGIPRSKSVHFDEQELSTLKYSSRSKEAIAEKLAAPFSEVQSIASAYSQKTSSSDSDSDKSIPVKKVREDLKAFLTYPEEQVDDDTSSDSSTEEESTILEQPLETNDALHSVYTKICLVAGLEVPKSRLSDEELKVSIDAGINDAMEAIAFSKKEILESEARSREKAAQFKKLREEVKQKEEALKQLEATCQEVKEENSRLRVLMVNREAPSKMRNARSELKDAQAKLERMLRESQAKIADLISRASVNSAQMDELKATNEHSLAKLTAINDRCNKEKQVLQDEIADLKRQVYEYKLAAATVSEDHESSIHSLKEELSKWKESEQAASSEARKAVQQYNEAMKRLDELALCLQAKEQTARLLEKLLETKNEEISKLREECQSKTTNLEELTKHVQTVSTYEDAVKTYNATIESLSKQVEEGRLHATNCQSAFTAKTKRDALVVQQISDLQASHQILVEQQRKCIKLVFEALAVLLYDESAQHFAQMYYELSRINIFNRDNQHIPHFLATFLSNAVRDLVKLYKKNEEVLSTEIKSRHRYQKEVLDTIGKIVDRALCLRQPSRSRGVRK